MYVCDCVGDSVVVGLFLCGTVYEDEKYCEFGVWGLGMLVGV